MSAPKTVANFIDQTAYFNCPQMNALLRVRTCQKFQADAHRLTKEDSLDGRFRNARYSSCLGCKHPPRIRASDLIPERIVLKETQEIIERGDSLASR